MAARAEVDSAAILSRNQLLNQLESHEMEELLTLANVERFKAQASRGKSTDVVKPVT